MSMGCLTREECPRNNLLRLFETFRESLHAFFMPIHLEENSVIRIIDFLKCIHLRSLTSHEFITIQQFLTLFLPGGSLDIILGIAHRSRRHLNGQ
jgi:hypothetical protein